MSRTWFVTLCLFALCVFSGFACALQVSPAQHTLTSGVTQDSYTLSVTNDEGRALSLTLTPTGPLASLITIPDALTLAPGETRSITVRVVRPEQTQPGVLESGILIEARPLSGGTITASSAILHLVRVETPRDGAHLAGELLVSSGVVKTPVLITVAVTNTGTVYLAAVNAVITIDGYSETLRTTTVSLSPGESQNMVVSWVPTAAGVYPLAARISYGDEETVLATSVVVGDLHVRADSLSFSDFRLGDPFRVSIAAVNEWGSPLPTTATVELIQNGQTRTQGRSTTVVLDSASAGTIPVFLESTGATIGPAALRVTLSYADRTTERTFPIIIGVDSISTQESGSVPSAWKSVLVVAVLLVLLLVAVVIFIKRRRQLPPQGGSVLPGTAK